MTTKELQNKLKTILGDYYYGKTTGKVSIKYKMEQEPDVVVSNKNIDNAYSKLLNVQNQPSAIQYKREYITRCKRTIYKYMRYGILIKENPEYACYKEKFENGLKVVDKLIARTARLEASHFEIYTNNHNEVDLDEVFSNEVCQLAYYNMDLIELIEKTFISTSVRDRLKELIPKDPKDEYPYARAIKRHFIIHSGLTNTGKTYHSLERLKEVESGVYLGPLRLLALEVQENLNNSGVLCDLVTGEEENIIPGAKHVASTVEKLDINKYYDVCVIDECQLVSDTDRGCQWARAILGVQAPEIHLACAPEAVDILKTMINSCHDTYEIINHERKTDLIFLRNRYQIPQDIEQGDALIVFSRKTALYMGDMLSNMGIPVSVIYGALPYASRKKQLERFLKGETKVVVSTDAIGMGLNLPIRRIIFLEQEKFDGIELRDLKPPEVKQIAGRAGRMGMYPQGFVLSTSKINVIQDGLNIPNDTIEKAYIGFSDVVTAIDGDLIKILKVWRSMPTLKDYRKTEITRYINLDILLKSVFSQLQVKPSKEIELKLLNIPFDEKNDKVLNLWLSYVQQYFKGKTIKMPPMNCKYLDEYETYYKCLDLYYSFSKNFGYDIDIDLLRKQKERTTTKINELLLATLSTNGQKEKIRKKYS